MRLGLSFAVLWNTSEARDVFRGGGLTTAAPTAAPVVAGTVPATTASAVPNASSRLIKTKDAMDAIRLMQQKARDLAKGAAGPNNIVNPLNRALDVPANSWKTINGLKPSATIAWDGAIAPSQPATASDGSTTVTITQTQQQAVLAWDSFNIGKTTTLNFDQSKGGTDAGQWIAFNKVGVTGSPSQILGSIKAEGQVYVINPNGIIFGGSSQVNAHALVASSLPINDNLVQRGLLNNPDAQFLLSALPQGAGTSTPAFTPTIKDENGIVAGSSSATSVMKITDVNSVKLNYESGNTGRKELIPGTDYTPVLDAKTGLVSVELTTSGKSKVAGGAVDLFYTPAGDQYGRVEVQAGAILTAPTNADHVGGRVALVGPNVSNAGTISTADGQAILAAGLQVAFAPHASADATLRGLDVYVGAVEDPALNVTTKASDGSVSVTNTGIAAGTVTNTSKVNSDKTVEMGLIEAYRGAVTLTGKTVNQNGFVESSTSVAYNGRVDLVAGYNAVANPDFAASQDRASSVALARPFNYRSNVGNDSNGASVANTGRITLGEDSVVRILPESTIDRVAGDLALPSQVSIQGQSILFGKNATVLAPGAAVPINKAYGSDGRPLEAGVTIRAGTWLFNGANGYQFVHANDSQQIYVDQGAVIDVAGSSGVKAQVAENIVSVELRGSELANSPLQRDGPLRGQTIQVDIRQHGPWDPLLNDGLGGYTWVGTPLADTAGWVGLATHSAEELTVNGGSVALKAGGAVVLHAGSTVDVSGGSINFQAGDTRTTKVSADGHIYDIAQATPDRKYDGIYSGTTTKTDPKWGMTTSTSSPFVQSTHEDAYTQGGSGGSLAISAPVMALDGTMHGNTTVGAAQRTLSPVYNPASPADPANPTVAGAPGWQLGALSRPIASQFSITIGRQHEIADGSYHNFSPTPANIIFTNKSSLPAADEYKQLGDLLAPTSYLFPTQRKYELDLATSLFDNDSGSGFGIVKINNSDDALGAKTLYAGGGNITVQKNTGLTLAPGGTLRFDAGNIVVESGGSITAKGGSIVLNAFGLSPSSAETINLKKTLLGQVPDADIPAYDPASARGSVVIAASSRLNVAGDVVDDRRTLPTSGTVPLVTKGGTIEIKSNSITLQSTSELDVSGGTTISATGKLAYGDAGRLILTAGKTQGSGFGTVLGGGLNFTGALLRGFAGVGANGGKLSVQAPSILIKTPLTPGATVLTDKTTGGLSLAPEFFSVGGFSDFSFTGLGVALAADGKPGGAQPAVTIADGTVVQPRVQNWESLPGGPVYLASEGIRKPVNLTIRTADLLTNVNGQSLDNSIGLGMGPKAVLSTEAGGSIVLSGGTVEILGRITAPAGSITVTQSGGALPFQPAIHFGAESVLEATGAPIYKLDDRGTRYKSDVLDGGTISVSGNIVAEKGGRFDVSGTFADASDPLNPLLAASGTAAAGFPTGHGTGLVPVSKESSGGTINLLGDQVLFFGATLSGGAGRLPGSAVPTTASNGTFGVTSNRGAFPLATSDSILPALTDPMLIFTATTPLFKYSNGTVSDAAEKPFGDVNALGLVRFGADLIQQGSFGKVTLSTNGRGAIQVQGNVLLTANQQIAVADGGVLSFVPDPAAPTAIPALTLNAPYVKLGLKFPDPQAAQSNPLGINLGSKHGAGVLAVNAGTLIDVGTLSLQNAGKITLDATYAKKSGASTAESGVTTGAIRGNGTLDLAGDITLKAGQIYPPTAVSFNIIAEDYTVKNTKGESVSAPGSVTIQSAGSGPSPALPLAAEGKLNIFASNITQGGTLRAPLGSIRLGSGDEPGLNPLSSAPLPTTAKLIMLPGSVTSVSALDPLSGKPITIPYGINNNGDIWIDPKGTDITGSGPAPKSIVLTADAIDLQAAKAGQAPAIVDIAGGGDLSAYQFVAGTGGKIDLLLGIKSGSFAVVPGYTDGFAPVATNSSTAEARINLGKDTGYVVSEKLKYQIGDRIHIDLQNGRGPQDYTLLSARYALLPGAYLVTPQTGTSTAGPAPSVTKPDGAVIVAGYRFNGLDAVPRTQSLYDSFEIATQAVVQKRAEYRQYSANTFFTDRAKNNNTLAPRLPADAGRLSLLAGSALNLQGTVQASAATGGRGGLVDISSTSDIVVGSVASLATPEYKSLSGTLLLDAKQLSDFGAESLLIGGVRSTGTDGTTVTVSTDNVTVDNAGEALAGSDVILVANKNLVLKKDAEVGQASGNTIASDPLKVVGSVQLKKAGDALTVDRGGAAISLRDGTGANLLTATSAGTVTEADGTKTPFDATTDGTDNTFTVGPGGTVALDQAGKIALANSDDVMVKPVTLTVGDGALVRVSSDPAAQITRSVVASSTAPKLTVGPGAKIIGASAILDSTHTTDLASKIDLGAVKNLSLNSGRVSVLLENPGTTIPTDSLVLSRDAQTSLLKSAASLSFLSYSTIDLYGTGTFGGADLGSLALHAGAIRGYPNIGIPGASVPPSPVADASVTVAAKSIVLDNAANAAAVVSAGPPKGTLIFDTGTLHLGDNQMDVQNYDKVEIKATGGVLAGDTTKLAAKTGGLTVVGGDLKINTPLLAGAGASNQSIAATSLTTITGGISTTTGGALSLLDIQGTPTSGTATVSSGLAAKLSLTGTKVDVGTAVKLPSGTLTVEATTGDLTVTGGNLDVSGTAQHFYDVTKYTDGGGISLAANKGDVTISAGSKVSVAANAGGGSAGSLDVSIPLGQFDIAADTLSGRAGTGGQGGAFSVDTVGIPGAVANSSNLATLSGALLSGGFDQSVAVRVREGDVLIDGRSEATVASGVAQTNDSTLRAHNVSVSADHGKITVTGRIDASGLSPADPSKPATDPTGGKIELSASGSVVLAPTASLSAAGYVYNNAGKGGTVSISAGGYTVDNNGVGHVDTSAKVDIQSGAHIDLNVLHRGTPNELWLSTDPTSLPVSNRTDLFSGTLRLRESQAAFGNGTQFSAVADSVQGASDIVLEGFQVFDLSGGPAAGPEITSVGSGGLIDAVVQKAVKDNGTAFLGQVDPAIVTHALYHVQPGAEIVNNDTAAGDLTLTKTWDLSTFRFGSGAKKEPGHLTLRAKGNLIFGFGASLSDGFSPSDPVSTAYPLWTAKLMNDRSWSYRLVAGADYSAANSASVQSLRALDESDAISGSTAGLVLLGRGTPALPGGSLSRSAIVSRYFQTIRTGTGDVDIAAGRDVQLLNPLATIYTAGRKAEPLAGFDVPVLDSPTADSFPALFPYYPAQYSLAGGDVTVRAQHDIARYSETDDGLVADSAQQMPTNWLYRRGNVGTDGNFAVLTGTPLPTSEIQSTSWWVDFSNFFADTGTLGGGNVTLVAGGAVNNVNAAAPTNARMPGKNAEGKPVSPDMSKLLELGGGDVTVRAGRDIDGGVYYVERGTATLHAGGEVKTNSTRTTDISGQSANPSDLLAATFFLGKGRVEVAAGGDLLLGPVANPFWLPQGSNNRVYEKTFFSTYSPAGRVTVTSLGGNITVQGKPDSATDGTVGESAAWLQAWYANILSSASDTAGEARPWLRLAGAQTLADGAINNFATVTNVRPGTLRATAYAGDINILGQLTLAPSPAGSLDLLAAGNINGFGVNGARGNSPLYGSAVINLSDADPTRMPGITSPLSFPSYRGTVDTNELNSINELFAESGTTSLSLQQKLALHGQTQITDATGKTALGPLHYNDPEPLRIYANGGDVSGLTLYSGKSARMMAKRDISDIALYVQNAGPNDTTLVAAGHDIVAYNPGSALRVAAQQSGGIVDSGDGTTLPGSGTPTAGDLQIAGSGTLEVLAARNLVLGINDKSNRDGTGVGITSVGSIRNPNLPQNSGAGIIAIAGAGSVYTSTAATLGQTPGLATTSLKLAGFVAKFLDPDSKATDALASRYLPVLGKLMNLTTTDATAIWSAFGFKPDQPMTERQAAWVLQLFNIVLRDSARDRNNPDSPDAGTYKNGLAAIEALFPGSPQPTKEDIASTVPVVRPASPWSGELSMSTRLIKTFEGGDITLLVPGGNVTVGRATDPQKPDQGILTQRGGGISIFAADSVNVGTSRIFTLRGGNEILWSTWGNIAAGSGSKTVFSAPPTRVLIDPQSSDVRNDLAGLATGSGIGVLATLSGVKPGDVDLIAPVGTIDAGDAGIRSSGNLNIAARVVLNASNIQVGGSSAGTPPPPPAPNLGSLSAASTASASTSSAAADVAKQNASNNKETVLPSMITVEVLGYGGGDEEEDDAEKMNKPADEVPVEPSAS